MNSVQRFISAAKPTVERIPWLASAYVGVRGYYRVLRKLQTEMQEPPAVVTPQGFYFAGVTSGHAAMAEGKWEADETALFMRLLAEADLIINVGANVGYYCCLALQAGKQVLAFEPLESNLRYLYQNIYRNGWSAQCEIYPVALGTANGLLELYGTGMGASLIKGWAGYAAVAPTLVPVFTFDSLIGRRTAGQRCVVLVDVEGAEHQFLRGASNLLNQDPKPIWLMEIHSRHSQPANVKVNPHLLDTFRLFWQAGYRSYVADATMQEMDEAAIVANANLPDILQQKYDFLFVEQGRPAA